MCPEPLSSQASRGPFRRLSGACGVLPLKPCEASLGLPASTPLATQDTGGAGKQPFPRGASIGQGRCLTKSPAGLHGGPAPREWAPGCWRGRTCPGPSTVLPCGRCPRDMRLISPHSPRGMLAAQDAEGHQAMTGPRGARQVSQGPCPPAPATLQVPADGGGQQAASSSHALSQHQPVTLPPDGGPPPQGRHRPA